MAKTLIDKYVELGKKELYIHSRRSVGLSVSGNQQLYLKKVKLFFKQHICAYCSIELEINEPISSNFWSLEHIVPRSLNGSNKLENLTLVCLKCNLDRGNSPLTNEQIANLKKFGYWNSYLEDNLEKIITK